MTELLISYSKIDCTFIDIEKAMFCTWPGLILSRSRSRETFERQLRRSVCTFALCINWWWYRLAQFMSLVRRCSVTLVWLSVFLRARLYNTFKWLKVSVHTISLVVTFIYTHVPQHCLTKLMSLVGLCDRDLGCPYLKNYATQSFELYGIYTDVHTRSSFANRERIIGMIVILLCSRLAI